MRTVQCAVNLTDASEKHGVEGCVRLVVHYQRSLQRSHFPLQRSSAISRPGNVTVLYFASDRCRMIRTVQCATNLTGASEKNDVERRARLAVHYQRSRRLEALFRYGAVSN